MLAVMPAFFFVYFFIFLHIVNDDCVSDRYDHCVNDDVHDGGHGGVRDRGGHVKHMPFPCWLFVMFRLSMHPEHPEQYPVCL